jgi:PAS domain S-box-containing protein
MSLTTRFSDGAKNRPGGQVKAAVRARNKGADREALSPELAVTLPASGDAARSMDWALDVLPLGVCMCDRFGRIVRYNRSAIELWGMAPAAGAFADDFLASLTSAFRSDGDARGMVGRVLATGQAIRDVEQKIGDAGIASVVVRVNVDPLLDSTGRVAGAVVCLRDVTESRRLHREIRDQERRFQQLLEALPVCVYTTDAIGRITFYNQAARAFWGHEPRLGIDQWCGSLALCWPDRRPMRHDDTPMARVLRDQDTGTRMEVMAVRPDGRAVHFLAYPVLLRDDAGRLTGAVNTLVDITDRRHSEELARDLASIVDSSSDAIIGNDLSGIITSWNRGAETMFGYDAADMVGRPVDLLVPVDRLEEQQSILPRIRRGEHVANLDTARRCKYGHIVDVSLAVSPVRDGHGAIVGASIIARDVTERRRAAEKQQLLLREMRHRVRNLFALASGIVTLSARFARSPQELAETVRARLNALSQAHELTLPDVSDVTEQADRVTTLESITRTILSPYCRAGRSDLIEISGPELKLRGAAVTGFALLLHEIATNAAKYGALSVPEGRLAVEWTIRGDQLELAWRESGGPTATGEGHVEGFGTLLGRATVEGQLGGSLTRHWSIGGLTIRLRVPLARLRT